MYANLIVKLSNGKEVVAWEVTFPDNGKVLVHLDDEFDESKYAQPKGLRSFDPAEIDTISANW